MPACAINLADDPTACKRTAFGDADEFVTEDSAKSHIAPDQLKIRFTNAGAQNLNRNFASFRVRLGVIRSDGHSVFEDDGAHESVR